MYKQTNTMEHCQCDWQGVQSDADNTEESITTTAPQQDAELQKLLCVQIQM